MFKKIVLLCTLVLVQSTAKAHVQACLSSMDSNIDVTRLNHGELDSLMGELFHSVNTRNLDAMIDVHDTCEFILNTEYIEAKKAYLWLRQIHDDLAADLSRPKRRNKKVAEIN